MKIQTILSTGHDPMAAFVVTFLMFAIIGIYRIYKSNKSIDVKLCPTCKLPHCICISKISEGEKSTPYKEWKERNTNKSINDYYAELRKNNKGI